MLEAAVSVSNNTTKSVKEQFGKDLNGDYTIFNDEYSNNFENIFFRESIELNYRYTEQNYNVMLGINGEPSQTRNRVNTVMVLCATLLTACLTLRPQVVFSTISDEKHLHASIIADVRNNLRSTKCSL